MDDRDRKAARDGFAWSLAAMVTAKTAVRDTATFSGSFECPAGCGGTVRWRCDPRKKHTRGACSTPECLSWIE